MISVRWYFDELPPDYVEWAQSLASPGFGVYFASKKHILRGLEINLQPNLRTFLSPVCNFALK